MKVFHCDHCQQTVFFENTNCTRCGHVLAFLPDALDVAALEPDGDEQWIALAPGAKARHYRLCANYTEHAVCNWVVPADDPNPLCVACRLTRVFPNLELEGSLDAWRKLEMAKRRMVAGLLALRLPLHDRTQDPAAGLAYDFLSDELVVGGPVLTGHDNGVITINVAEADDLEREKRRLALHEPYRTLLGHFRHEVGHYYWDRLVRDGGHLVAFRECFGDERQDYGEALKRHYEQGPRADWSDSFISSYASSHPWEDWAETWAHYMHMMDSLETARACGVLLAPPRSDEPSLEPVAHVDAVYDMPFDRLIDDWLSLTYALNNLSRSLGQPDSYPFVLVGPTIDKLRLIHRIVRDEVTGRTPVTAPVHSPDRSAPPKRKRKQPAASSR